MIAIRKSPKIEIKGIEHVSHRLITADMVIQGIKMKVIVAYAPTERGDSDKKKAETVKNTFWHESRANSPRGYYHFHH